MSGDIHVPKRKISVEVAYEERPGECVKQNFTLFLNQFSPNHKGEETIDEFLNGGKQFIPASKEQSGEFIIANLDAVLYVKEILKVETSEESEKPLTIHFTSGDVIEVEHYEELPRFRSRPTDYLNSESKFLLYLYEKSKVYINKNRIRKVTGL